VAAQPGGELGFFHLAGGSDSITITQSASLAPSTQPFSARNSSVATKAVRLLPSTKGWLRASPKP